MNQNLARPFTWTHEYINEILCNSKDKIVFNKYLKKAFDEVDRADFLPKKRIEEAYIDKDVLIGHGEYLTRLTTIALMLELLDIKKGGKYLDIGTGSGYVAMVIANAVGARGEVISIERNQFLIEIARLNSLKYPFIKNLKLQFGDGIDGFKQQAPYDGIHISASYDEIPETLKWQLKIGGKLIAPLCSNKLILIERLSVTSYKETLHKTFFFGKIKAGIDSR